MSNSNFSSKTLLPVPNQQPLVAGSSTTINEPGSSTPDISDPEKGSPMATPTAQIIRGGGLRALFTGNGALAPFRLLKSDLKGRPKLYHTDWHFNQLILASAVFVFFTNLLPGITFASDLYILTGKNYGTIEVVFSTGLCGIVFALWVTDLIYLINWVLGWWLIMSDGLWL